jgi:hypothetical protein
MVHYRNHKSLSPVPVVSQINPIHVFVFNFRNTNFNILRFTPKAMFICNLDERLTSWDSLMPSVSLSAALQSWQSGCLDCGQRFVPRTTRLRTSPWCSWRGWVKNRKQAVCVNKERNTKECTMCCHLTCYKVHCSSAPHSVVTSMSFPATLVLGLCCNHDYDDVTTLRPPFCRENGLVALLLSTDFVYLWPIITQGRGTDIIDWLSVIISQLCQSPST